MKRRNKFGNVKTVLDGNKFDSLKESRRYASLKLLALGGVIRDLELQPRIPLLVNGIKVATYVGDFRYFDTLTGKTVIEDVKSEATKTPVYNLKKKILAAQNPPIHIVEV